MFQSAQNGKGFLSYYVSFALFFAFLVILAPVGFCQSSSKSTSSSSSSKPCPRACDSCTEVCYQGQCVASGLTRCTNGNCVPSPEDCGCRTKCRDCVEYCDTLVNKCKPSHHVICPKSGKCAENSNFCESDCNNGMGCGCGEICEADGSGGFRCVPHPADPRILCADGTCVQPPPLGNESCPDQCRPECDSCTEVCKSSPVRGSSCQPSLQKRYR